MMTNFLCPKAETIVVMAVASVVGIVPRKMFLRVVAESRLLILPFKLNLDTLILHKL